DVVMGTQAIRRLPMLVEQAGAGRVGGAGPGGRADGITQISAPAEGGFPLGITRPNHPPEGSPANLEGWNEFCSFWVVPYTRGNERMRPKADILAEVREAAASGRVEVQLLGQIVNHYDAPDDPSCDFTGLLEAIHDVDGIERIRFASPHPR